ncbi:MAG: hypothetical protein NTZ03_11100 [Actinobacteria bacterium]|nr:hypothetical protein [Actinomycetota bacterium]
MSAAPALSPRDHAAAPVERALHRLRALPGGRRRLGTTAFGLTMGGLLVVGLLLVLLLNTVLAQGAFAIHTLEQQATVLKIQQQQLAQEVAALDTPDALRQRAENLGMVRVNTPVFLRLKDGKVLGHATTVPGTRAALPTVTRASPAPSSAASSSTSGSTSATKAAASKAAPVQAKPTAGDAAVPAPEGAEVVAAGGGSSGAVSDQAKPVTSGSGQ